MKKCFMYGLLMFFLGGCASMGSPKEGTIFERQGVSALLIAPEMRDVYFNDPSSLERHCRAPGPDVSIESSSGVSFGVSIAGDADKISDGSSQAGLALGGRNPAVLITRELMYRACELSSNLNASKKDTLLIYERFLQAAEKSFPSQTGAGSATASDAATPISLANVNQATKPSDTNTGTDTTDAGAVDAGATDMDSESGM